MYFTADFPKISTSKKTFSSSNYSKSETYLINNIIGI